MRLALLTVLPLLYGCGDDSPSGFAAFERHVQASQIGGGADEWIEMKNLAGEWERTGLIFGYDGGDREECLKAIAGLKKVNFAREYRCTRAN